MGTVGPAAWRRPARSVCRFASIPGSACVTQGMKNKEIALRVGTTEQVVKNYLRKVYDKLGVADRLELALYCLNHRVGDNAMQSKPTQPTNGHAATSPETPNTNAAASGSRS